MKGIHENISKTNNSVSICSYVLISHVLLIARVCAFVRAMCSSGQSYIHRMDLCIESFIRTSIGLKVSDYFQFATSK